MKEGKLPISLLKKLISFTGSENKGIVSKGKIGSDVAVIDINSISQKAIEFYEVNGHDSTVLLVEKSDPITFPTAKPGYYAVAVNSNDIACVGAIPFGFLLTIIAPPETDFVEIEKIQKEAHETCKKMGITILGGHTEISDSVNRVVISGHMIGLVPKEYYPPQKLEEGNLVVFVGNAGAEGTSIILSEAREEELLNILSKAEIMKGKQYSNDISIINTALEINRLFRPNLMHDTTEGGIIGAIYELIADNKVGIKLDKLPKLSNVTKKLSHWLEFDPYRLISSGGLLVIIDKEKANSLVDYLNKRNIDSEIIGEVTANKGKLLYDEKIVEEPHGDEIITALNHLYTKVTR